MDLVDTHCHLNFERYDHDRGEVIKRASTAGVNRIIIPAIDAQSAGEALQLAQHYDRIFVAVGIHPNSSADYSQQALKTIELMLDKNKVVAIGEIGLDYYRDRSPKNVQRQAFEAQLSLAAQYGIPVIIHNREADKDTLSILKEWVKNLPVQIQDRPGVLHSFSAPQEIAEQVLSLGFYLGFTGPITFNTAQELRRVAGLTPLDRILVETDGPFLTPVPYRGQRNEPAYLVHIAETLADIKGTSPEAIAKATTDNAIRLFRLVDHA